MILETDRLLLREFVEADWEAVLAYQSQAEYLRFYPWTQRTESDVRAFVGMFIDWQRQQPRTKFQLAVTIKGSGRLIGNAGIRVRDVEARQADLGYELAPVEWGKGYATEAARAMLNFGFRSLRLHRIWAECIAENTASVHVLEKLGMHQEAHLHENQWFKSRWWDTLIYAILEDGQER